MRRFDAGEYLHQLGTGLVRMVVGGIAATIGVVMAGIALYFAADYSAEQRIARDTAEQRAALARRGYSATDPAQGPANAQGWGAAAVEAAQSEPAN